MNMFVAQRTVGPAEARSMLDKDPGNYRNPRPRHVSMLASDMRQGSWKFNGETIKISSSGRVIDGQHRLLAVIESGVTVDLLIIDGLEEGVEDTIDTGAARTFKDALKYQQVPFYEAVAPACTRIYCWSKLTPMAYRTAANIKPSVSQLLRTLEDNPEIVDSAAFVNPLRRGTPLPPAVMVTTHFLFSKLDREDAEDFFLKLATGASLAERHPILKLRNRLIEARFCEVEKAAITIKSWNAYREGREVGLLRFKVGGKSPEAFPLPR